MRSGPGGDDLVGPGPQCEFARKLAIDLGPQFLKVLRRKLIVQALAEAVQIGAVRADDPLVLRLLARLPEGRVLSEAELLEVPQELGWLMRLA